MASLLETDGIRAYLLTQATVTAIVSSGATARIYPVKLPQNPTFPALTIQTVSGPGEHVMNGPAGVAAIFVQIQSFGKTEPPDHDGYQDSRDLADAVRQAMDGVSGTFGSETVGGAFLQNRRDIYDDRIECYIRSQDWMFWHTETTP